ncbi:MAG: NusG domain II-containing protein [Tissierellia bacterium]|nr:NusG domain II-containing protein [Tissierellia bacterium]
MTKGDKLLIVFIVLISFSLMGYFKMQAFSDDDKYVSIQVNGEEIKRFIFDSKLIGQTIPIETKYGYNLIEIGDEKVRVIEADCPDKIDVKQGYISNIGETIVCLPNRLIIEIKGIDSNMEVDIIVR